MSTRRGTRSGWGQDSHFHFLLLKFPDFRKEEVKLVVDTNSGRMTVTGERQVSENKNVKFDKTFYVPEDSDITKITGNFRGEIFYIIIPKKSVKLKGEFRSSENEKSVHVTHELDDDDEEEEEEEGEGGRKSKDIKNEGFIKSSIKIVRENTRNVVVVSAVLAFSLGLLVSRKFKYNKQKRVAD